MHRFVLLVLPLAVAACEGAPVVVDLASTHDAQAEGAPELGSDAAPDVAGRDADAAPPDVSSADVWTEPGDAGADVSADVAEDLGDAGADVDDATRDTGYPTVCSGPITFGGNGIAPPATCSIEAPNYPCAWDGGASGCVVEANIPGGFYQGENVPDCRAGGGYPCCEAYWLQTPPYIVCTCKYCPAGDM